MQEERCRARRGRRSRRRLSIAMLPISPGWCGTPECTSILVKLTAPRTLPASPRLSREFPFPCCTCDIIATVHWLPNRIQRLQKLGPRLYWCLWSQFAISYVFFYYRIRSDGFKGLCSMPERFQEWERVCIGVVWRKFAISCCRMRFSITEFGVTGF